MGKLMLSSSSTERRHSAIRKARSVNDITAILQEISKEIKLNSSLVGDLTKVLASTSGRNIEEQDEIKINKVLPTPSRRINTKSTPTLSSLGVKLEKFVVPPLDKIKSSVGIVQNLYDNASELDAVEALLAQSFEGSKNQAAALASVKALKNEVNATINKALTSLSKIADKHVPSEMKTLITRIIGFVLDTVDPKTYSEITELVYVSTGKDQLWFSLYLCLNDLKDEKGFTYSEFYIVLTGVVKDSTITYFLNTLPDFKVPGKYELGKDVQNEKAALQRIKFLLGANDILSDAERRPMPATKDQLDAKGIAKIPYVSSADVKDDTIIVHLKPNIPPSKFNGIVTQIIPLLKAVVGLNSRSKSIFKWKIVKSAGGRNSLQFVLTPDIRSDDKATLSMNLTKLRELQSALDLTPEELSAIKKALKSFL